MVWRCCVRLLSRSSILPSRTWFSPCCLFFAARSLPSIAFCASACLAVLCNSLCMVCCYFYSYLMLCSSVVLFVCCWSNFVSSCFICTFFSLITVWRRFVCWVSCSTRCLSATGSLLSVGFDRESSYRCGEARSYYRRPPCTCGWTTTDCYRCYMF